MTKKRIQEVLLFGVKYPIVWTEQNYQPVPGKTLYVAKVAELPKYLHVWSDFSEKLSGRYVRYWTVSYESPKGEYNHLLVSMTGPSLPGVVRKFERAIEVREQELHRLRHNE